MQANLDFYFIFYTVTRCGSISKAAEELLITRPTVTEQLHRLENHLNLKLLNTSTKGISLSLEGQRLFDEIAPIIQSLYSVEKRYYDMGHLQSGIIHLCFNNYSASKVFQYVTKDFTTMHPEVMIQTSIIPRETIANVLENKIVDFSFVARPRPGEPPKSKIVNTSIKQFSLGLFDDVIVAHKHLSSSLAGSSHHFSDLIRDYTFLFQRDLDEGSHGYYARLLEDIPYADSKIVVYNDIDALFDLLRYTDTIGLVPRLAFNLYPRKNDYQIINTFEPLLGTEYMIHINANNPMSFTASKLIGYLFNYPEFSSREMECSL